MASRIAGVRDAVVTELGNLSLDPLPAAVATYVPELQLKELTTGEVKLFVRTAVTEEVQQGLRGSRGIDLPVVPVEILVASRVETTEPLHADPVLEVAEAVDRHLREAELAGYSRLRSQIDSITDAGLFDSLRVVVFGVQIDYVFAW